MTDEERRAKLAAWVPGMPTKRCPTCRLEYVDGALMTCTDDCPVPEFRP